MEDQEIRDRFTIINGEYKAINDSLILIAKEQIRSGTENSAALKNINGKLDRMNGTVKDHCSDIEKLKDFVKEHRITDTMAEDVKKNNLTNRRLIYVAILGLVASIILNLIF